MNQWHYNKIKQLKDWERDLRAVLAFKNDMDEETRKDIFRYISLLDYAIDQIERVQELEDKLARIRFVNNDYDKINKRYREALEFYAKPKNWLPQNEDVLSLITMDYGEKARGILEELE